MYRLQTGDKFSVKLKIFKQKIENLQDDRISFQLVRTYKMVKWYNPATWFRKWVEIMFVDKRDEVIL